jgi:two-component system response regulator GlrR
MQTHPDPMASQRRFALDVLVGASEAMIELRRQVERAAAMADDVLLQGEPGTGKELAARVIHERSGNRGPFIKVESRAPAGVLDSRLFGPKTPKSTLFLRDVGDLPTRMQAQLRDALEERNRTGPESGGRAPFSEVRIVAASSRNLSEACRAGTFFEPLFQRLAANTIEVPPLRVRRDDIPLLLEHFLDELKGDLSHHVESFSPAALEILARRNWAGNVGELYEYVRTTVILAKVKVIEPMDLWLPRGVEDVGVEPWNLGYRELRRRVLLRFEADFVGRVLKAAGGNVSMAARLAKIDRKHLWRLIQRTGIRLERLEK